MDNYKLSNDEVHQMLNEVEVEFSKTNSKISFDDMEFNDTAWLRMKDTVQENDYGLLFFNELKYTGDAILTTKSGVKTFPLVWIFYVEEKIDNKMESVEKFIEELINIVTFKYDKESIPTEKIKYEPQVFIFSRKKSNITLFNSNDSNGAFSKLKISIDEKIKTLTNNKSKATKIHLVEINHYSTLDKIDINIHSRSQRATTNEIYNNSGDIYTARLYDLVEMYNRLGDRLFQHNLRFGSEDEMDLHSNIHRTLMQFPEEFWHLNNGITLLVSNEKIDLKDPKKITFENIDDKTLFSVINGAQTLNASSEYFYKLTENNEELENAIKNAWVVLRIVSVNTKTNENEVAKNTLNTRWVNKVAVALNRQKPIKVEDLANAVLFIQEINNVVDKKYDFQIIKTGQIAYASMRKYSLPDFVQVLVTCYSKKPWKAKNSTKELMKINNLDISLEKKEISKNTNTEEIEVERTDFIQEFEDESFRGQKDIFKDSSYEIIDEFKTQVFDKHYKPVNYLMNVYYIFNEHQRRLKKNKYIKTETGERIKNNLLMKISDVINENEFKKQHFNDVSLSDAELKKLIEYGSFHILCCFIWSKHEFMEDNEESFSNWEATVEDAKKDATLENYISAIITFSSVWIKNQNIESKSQLNEALVISNFKNTIDETKFDKILTMFKTQYKDNLLTNILDL